MRFDNLLPSPFYRVSIKLVVQDDQGRMLVVRTKDGWEVPGGGWEHNEELEDCMRRELHEELGVGFKSHGAFLFMYRGLNVKNYMSLKFAFRADVDSHNFKVVDEEILESRFVTKNELVGLPMQEDEARIKDYVDKLWPD